MFFIDDTLHCFSLTTHGSFESAKQLGWGLALLPNVRRDLLPPMPMHGAQPPTLRLSFQWSLSSREAENDNPTAHFALAHTSRCMYCAQVHGFLLSCFLFCEVSFLPETFRIFVNWPCFRCLYFTKCLFKIGELAILVLLS